MSVAEKFIESFVSLKKKPSVCFTLTAQHLNDSCDSPSMNKTTSPSVKIVVFFGRGDSITPWWEDIGVPNTWSDRS